MCALQQSRNQSPRAFWSASERPGRIWDKIIILDWLPTLITTSFEKNAVSFTVSRDLPIRQRQRQRGKSGLR